MSQRLPHIDLLKLVAANLLVLHHLAAYGPIPDVLATSAPRVISWLYDYARMAVQIFLVIGGYLAAKGLSLHRRELSISPLKLIAHRYRRLTLPYFAALGLSIAAASLARLWLQGEWIPSAPTWEQVLAHGFLLQSLLGVQSLSAGVWYIAIDFQLYALITALLWLGGLRAKRHPARGGILLVLLFLLAALFHFNRDEAWDNWALYFFGAYGLGAMAYWTNELPHARFRWVTRTGVVLLVLVALAMDFRTRLALALCTAVLLGIAHNLKFSLPQWSNELTRGIRALGQRSYSLFLVHFPVCLLGNAIFFKLGLTSSATAAVGFLACWASSLVVAHFFYRWVEAPLNRR